MVSLSDWCNGLPDQFDRLDRFASGMRYLIGLYINFQDVIGPCSLIGQTELIGRRFIIHPGVVLKILILTTV